METEDPIIYPIPLREGVVAKLQLPRDLTKDDAEKIARVVMALALPNGTRETPHGN